MRRILVQPYRQASRSSKAIAAGLGYRRVLLRATRFVPRDDDLIINWGSSKQLFADEYYFNKPSQVLVAANKRHTLQALYNVNTEMVPQFKVELPTPYCDVLLDGVKDWMDTVGTPVYCRTTLTGNSGAGIVVAETPDELVEAPLYTAMFGKDYEVRVHVINGEAFDFQQKRRRSGSTNTDRYIFNHGNDWVFCRNSIDIPASLIEEAKQLGTKAVTTLGLDMGAVDIGIKGNGEMVVFEVNTAPGVTGTTLQNYLDKLGEL